MKKKNNYQKPVVIDLGRISMAQGQQAVPMGRCQNGPSPSGFGSRCDNGNGNVNFCWLGVGYLGILDNCSNGNNASSFCNSGNSVG